MTGTSSGQNNFYFGQNLTNWGDADSARNIMLITNPGQQLGENGRLIGWKFIIGAVIRKIRLQVMCIS